MAGQLQLESSHIQQFATTAGNCFGLCNSSGGSCDAQGIGVRAEAQHINVHRYLHSMYQTEGASPPFPPELAMASAGQMGLQLSSKQDACNELQGHASNQACKRLCMCIPAEALAVLKKVGGVELMACRRQ